MPRRLKLARRIAHAIRLTRRGVPVYGAIPLRLISDPERRERHIRAPRDREIRREWDRLGIPEQHRGSTR